MNASSTAYITCMIGDMTCTYHFTGVTAIEHNLTLDLDTDSSQGTDIVNGARNQSDQVSLSVVETDVASQLGWAASMLAALDSIRRNRVLCRVVTSMGSWENMLLSEITATQDEANQYGWAGDIVFMQYIPRSEQYYTDTSGGGGASTGSSVSSTRKTQNNSSTKKNTGTKAAASTVSSTAASAVSGALATVLGRAGITSGTLYKS